jgi:hypothetical protein
MKLRINRCRVRTKLGRQSWAPGAHLGRSGSLRSFSRYRRNRRMRAAIPVLIADRLS